MPIRTRKNFYGFIDPITAIGVLFLVITLAVGVVVTKNNKISLNINEKAGTMCGYCNGATCVSCSAGRTDVGECTSSKQCEGGGVPGSVCGNGQCQDGETPQNCPNDCMTSGGPYCGDGNCNGTETAGSCDVDCGNESPACQPRCGGRACGDDGCGDICGSCVLPSTCNSSGQCTVPGCTPSCTGKMCGDNGCGGNCGTCPGGSTCQFNSCIANATTPPQIPPTTPIDPVVTAPPVITVPPVTDPVIPTVPPITGTVTTGQANEDLSRDCFYSGGQWNNTTKTCFNPDIEDVAKEAEQLIASNPIINPPADDYDIESTRVNREDLTASNIVIPPSVTTPKYTSKAECQANVNQNSKAYEACGQYATRDENLANLFKNLNSLSFGVFNDWANSYSPDKVKISWEGNYSSLEECQKDLGSKYGNRGAASCNTYVPTKEQTVNSVKLGSIITAEGALLTTGLGFGTGSLTGAQALTQGLAISTVNQTGTAVSSCIQDNTSKQCKTDTTWAFISWLNVGSAAKLTNAVTSGIQTAIDSAKKVNMAVNAINIAADAYDVTQNCFGENKNNLGCTMSAVGGVLDIGGGAVDIIDILKTNSPGFHINQADEIAKVINPVIIEQDLFTADPNLFDPGIRVTYDGVEYSGIKTVDDAQNIAAEISSVPIVITPEMHIKDADNLIAQFENSVENINIAEINIPKDIPLVEIDTVKVADVDAPAPSKVIADAKPANVPVVERLTNWVENLTGNKKVTEAEKILNQTDLNLKSDYDGITNRFTDNAPYAPKSSAKTPTSDLETTVLQKLKNVSSPEELPTFKTAVLDNGYAKTPISSDIIKAQSLEEAQAILAREGVDLQIVSDGLPENVKAWAPSGRTIYLAKGISNDWPVAKVNLAHETTHIDLTRKGNGILTEIGTGSYLGDAPIKDAIRNAGQEDWAYVNHAKAVLWELENNKNLTPNQRVSLQNELDDTMKFYNWVVYGDVRPPVTTSPSFLAKVQEQVGNWWDDATHTVTGKKIKLGDGNTVYVDKYIAKGAQADVSKGHITTNTGRTEVAVKKLRTPTDEEADFIRAANAAEIEILNTTTSSVKPKYYGMSGNDTIVLEYIEGVSVEEFLRTATNEQKILLYSKIKEALSTLYKDTGLPHGDLNQVGHYQPSYANLILTPGGEIKFVDQIGMVRYDDYIENRLLINSENLTDQISSVQRMETEIIDNQIYITKMDILNGQVLQSDSAMIEDALGEFFPGGNKPVLLSDDIHLLNQNDELEDSLLITINRITNQINIYPHPNMNISDILSDSRSNRLLANIKQHFGDMQINTVPEIKTKIEDIEVPKSSNSLKITNSSSSLFDTAKVLQKTQRGSVMPGLAILASATVGLGYADQYFDWGITDKVVEIFNNIFGFNIPTGTKLDKSITPDTSTIEIEGYGSNNLAKYLVESPEAITPEDIVPPAGLTKTTEGRCQRVDRSNPCDGNRMYELYIWYKSQPDGWWYTNGEFTPADFLALMLVSEAGKSDTEFLNAITTASSSQLWGSSAEHQPYCTTSDCEAGIFNFIGAYMQSASRRYNEIVLNENGNQESVINIDKTMAENFARNGIDLRKIATDTIYNPVSKTYNNDTPVHWGNFGCGPECEYLGPNWIKDANQTEVKTGTTDRCGLYDMYGTDGVLAVVFTNNQKYNWTLEDSECFK